MHSRSLHKTRCVLATLLLSAGLAGAVVGVNQSPAAAVVTSVKGFACGFITNVGLFGGPQAKLGCEPQVSTASVTASAATRAPSVTLPAGGSTTAVTANDPDGAKAQYGPAVIMGGRWPCSETNCPASATQTGPMSVSTQGTPAGGTVTSSADITLFSSPPVVGCDPTWLETHPGATCHAVGGFGPFPVEGDSVHVECSASESSVTGSTTITNGELSTATDGYGEPITSEPVPTNPPANYTRHGVITNVGDVFTVVYNEQIINSDGSITVNGAHMYLFGPTAVGEVIKGTVTCGTSPSPASTADTRPPTCGLPVVQPVSPEDPTPQSPRTELIGVFDTRGLQSITNIQAVNTKDGTINVGNPSSSHAYLKLTPGQTGPLQITAVRSDAAEAAGLPMEWSFDATDVAGNTTHCRVALGLPAGRAEFDNDGRTDLSVFRPGGGSWFIRPSGGAADTALGYGNSTDIPVRADYDGDRKTDIAIFRPSTGLWSMRRSSDGIDTLVTYGISTDIPVPGDYDNDGKADIAIFRPSLGLWWYRHSSNGADVATTFGVSGDIPVVADWDGDSKTDLAVFRPGSGTWFVHPSAGGPDLTLQWGASGDVPVVGDFDGDGRANAAIYRRSTGLWAIRSNSGDTTLTTYGGITGDVPVTGDYDGDSKVDIAIFRPSSGGWFVRSSVSGSTTVSTFGISGDVPLPMPAAIRMAFTWP